MEREREMIVSLWSVHLLPNVTRNLCHKRLFTLSFSFSCRSSFSKIATSIVGSRLFVTWFGETRTARAVTWNSISTIRYKCGACDGVGGFSTVNLFSRRVALSCNHTLRLLAKNSETTVIGDHRSYPGEDCPFSHSMAALLGYRIRIRGKYVSIVALFPSVKSFPPSDAWAKYDLWTTSLPRSDLKRSYGLTPGRYEWYRVCSVSEPIVLIVFSDAQAVVLM